MHRVRISLVLSRANSLALVELEKDLRAGKSLDPRSASS
jgi:hypothetical protein